jgi:hypothetical protein
LAFRGHLNDEGNFKQLLLVRGKDNATVQNWLERKLSWTSPLIQNEILLLFSHNIIRSIADKIRHSGHFAVIVDGTQDASKKEQLSICMRYVDEEFVPCEEFIGLFEPPNTTGATLATCIKDVCLRLQLPLSMLRVQTHDGASNMSGEHRGCQAIICQEQPLALYVHCGAHCINLVSAAVSDSCPSVRNALQVLNDLGALFSQSIVARSTFSAIVDTDFRS